MTNEVEKIILMKHKIFAYKFPKRLKTNKQTKNKQTNKKTIPLLIEKSPTIYPRII